MKIDFSKVETIHAVEPSTKFPGMTLVTCRYFGNDQYQFLADKSEMTILSKEHDFTPEDETKVSPPAKGKK